AALAACALMGGVSACDQSPTGADYAPQPSYSVRGEYRADVPVKGLVKYQRSVNQREGSAIFSVGGGWLAVGNHRIRVPKHAVDQPVLFSMQVVPGDTVHVKLEARRLIGGEPYGNFHVPVTLYLSYADANPSSSARLLITYLIDGTTSGAKQGLPSAVRAHDQTVSAQLIHFSDYALGEN
ncbi:MAG TPA: hypothetical protein VF021_07475, partial [Longimicrobiales bacterium]